MLENRKRLFMFMQISLCKRSNKRTSKLHSQTKKVFGSSKILPALFLQPVDLRVTLKISEQNVSFYFIYILFIYLFVYLFIYLSVDSFIYLFTYLFIYLFICLFICLFIYLFIYITLSCYREKQLKITNQNRLPPPFTQLQITNLTIL